jgi:hypothetical protein
MNANNLESKFAAMGARMKVREIPSRWRQGNRAWISPHNFTMDIRRDSGGEFFELRVPTHLRDALDVSVMQSVPQERHLLLAVRKTGGQPTLDRFLCGHDEREWFVAAVPGGASSVHQANRLTNQLASCPSPIIGPKAVGYLAKWQSAGHWGRVAGSPSAFPTHHLPECNSSRQNGRARP